MSNNLYGTEDDLINKNLTNHEEISKFLRDSIQNGSLFELEDNLNDLEEIQVQLDQIRDQSTYEILEPLPNNNEIIEIESQSDSLHNDSEFTESNSDVSEEISGDEEEKH